MHTYLSRAHQNTYEKIFRRPAAHNLQWCHVRSLLTAIADVVLQKDRSLRVTRNGHSLVLRPERHKDVHSVEELKKLRHFLERSEPQPGSSAQTSTDVLVVIDHRQARVFRTGLDSPDPVLIEPDDPVAGRHLHYVKDEAKGQRRPECKSYYDAIARSLDGAERILVFGSGTGASSAMARLVEELELHYKPIAARIVGAVTVDGHHMTDAQMLADAREHYRTLD